ncbi:hypothetical protein [Deinococcus cellulosilyticus]|uniref:ATPase AAA n=1 Tax=Deinococcus cellulosilyticus (strain DSM 18568 / NBRC 106333 / KACC 11606 / 5516J-15) TaxID=1223518 RepID=A0A511MYU9_DEIC1|nr:hypothetical protein [Deinococcus cellulosilyticus]GEM45785.1 ATPase AAA [Deinococcus cellulosilyticus NBRC 106333 = KACC 11606]
MQRVMILGEPGSGKSTLATALGAKQKLPVVHLDRIFWQPGWQEPDPATFKAQHDRCASEERWIIDGIYWKTIDFRAQRADTIIWLDLPLWLRLYRVLRRTLITLGKSRPDLAPGCPEKFDFGFYHYILIGHQKRNQRISSLLEKFEGTKQVIVLRSRREVQQFLEGLQERPVGGGDLEKSGP